MLIDILTYTASLRACVETVDLNDLRTVLRSNMLKLLDKQTERKVVDFASPKPRHAHQVQVLDTDGAVPTAQLMARLPLPVVTTVADALMATLQVPPPPAAVVGAFLAAGQGPRPATQLIQALLKKQGIVNLRPVTQREVRLQTEVHTHQCTFT